MTEVEKLRTIGAKVVLGVSVSLLVVSLTSNAWLYTQMASLQNIISDLEAEYDDYAATHTISDSEYLALSINYTVLQQNHQTLTESYNKLLLDFDNLTEDYSQLQLSYQQLNTTYHDLQREHEHLENTYQTLNTAYNSYRAAYRQLASLLNLHVDHPSQDEKLLITPEDQAVESKVEEITGGWSNPSDWNEYWSDVKKMYDWVRNNIQYRYDGLYPVLPEDPSQPVEHYDEMWQFPNQTLDLRKGDCDDMAILLCSMIYSYGNMEVDVECIVITQHIAVYIPVAEDEICILDPSGNYYTNTGFPFYEITSKDISYEVHHWLDYWSDSIGYPKVDWIFSAYIWEAFSDTEQFINWLYDRYSD